MNCSTARCGFACGSRMSVQGRCHLALGLHPYFFLPLGDGGNTDRAIIQVPTSEVWELNEMLPNGKKTAAANKVDLAAGAAFGDLELDDVFGGLTFHDGRCSATITDRAAASRLVIEFSELFSVLRDVYARYA